MTKLNAMTLKIGRRLSATVVSFEAASQLYASKRNASGQGGSKWPTGEIIQDGKTIARVSYNSRIWPAVETPDEKPLYDPACCHCGGTPCCCETPLGSVAEEKAKVRTKTIAAAQARIREGSESILDILAVHPELLGEGDDDTLINTAIAIDAADLKLHKGAK